MSNFLNKFTNKEYNDMDKLDCPEDKTEILEIDDSENIEEHEDIQVKEITDTKTTLKTTNTKDEVYIKDEEKIKKRKKTIMICSVCFVAVLGLSMFGYYKINQVRVPNFIADKTLEEVQVWAAKNKIEMEYTSEFSEKIDNNHVIEQSNNKGSNIQKGSHMEFVISKGADPDEHIEIPDFMKMDLVEIEEWKKKNKAVNVSINKEYNEEVKKSNTISFLFKTEGIDASNYRRKDKINIIISLGEETYEKNIEVPDFKGKTQRDVDQWAKDNEIVIEYIEVADNKIASGSIISQDAAPRSKVAKKDVIKITMSRGLIVYMPDFSGLNETQSQIMANAENVNINVLSYYSNDVQASHFLSQSLPVGTEVAGEMTVLIFSLGKPYINNFDGDNVYTMVQAIDAMNSQGANLTYEIRDVDSSEKKGTIITSNYKACFVNIGTHIVIESSKGI